MLDFEVTRNGLHKIFRKTKLETPHVNKKSVSKMKIYLKLFSLVKNLKQFSH